jgi:hypothetical protein
MKYTRLLLIVWLTVFIHCAYGQQQVLLKGIILPNTVYKTQMTNNMDMEVTIKGDSATMAEMDASGMKNPVGMTIKQEVLSTIRSGAAKEDKRVPVTISYDKMNIHTNVGGQETTQDDNPFANVEIRGFADDGKMMVDTIIGNLDDARKASLRSMVNNLQGNIKFPDKPLKIGESFNQDVPLVVPMGQVQFKMNVHVTSTLKEIKGSKAIFDMKQDITLDMNMAATEASMSGSGSGTGVMTFDIEKKMMDQTDIDMQYHLDVNMQGMTMSAKCKAKQAMKFEIQ